MKITWLGHSGFRIEIGDCVLLVDPWFTGNPVFPAGREEEACTGATHILLSHGHGDHSSDTLAIAKSHDIPIVGIYDLMSFWEETETVKTIGFNKGGNVSLSDQVSVTMTNAVHSSSIAGPNGPIYAGAEAGFLIFGENKTIYFSGDTDVMADMEIIGDRYVPDIGILCAGGHFTMDMEGAAYAAERFFDFKTLIPCHYKTFPILEQSAQAMIDVLPHTDVKTPEVMEALEF
jgi:L-ascorbate metabolism protein UlaG (beta-lactamase superfamily)